MKNQLLKRIVSAAMILVLVLALAACGGKTEPDPTQPSQQTETGGNTPAGGSGIVSSLTYALRNGSWDLAPWKGNGSSANSMWLCIYGNLLSNPAFGTALEDMEKNLAKSVEISADGLTATVELFDYIRDSKGNDIKAEDVVFSYQTAPKASSIYAKIDSVLDSVAATGDYTVEMKLKNSAPGNWELLLANCPIVSKSWYESASDEEKSLDPACTGAYYIKENAIGTSVTMAMVENFWQTDELRSMYQKAPAKELVFVSIPEDTMRVVALENREVDAAYLETTAYDLFADNPDYSIFSTTMSNPTVFVLNCAEGKPLSDNADLRKAVLHALNFEQIAVACSGSFVFRSHDLASPRCGNYEAAWDSVPYFDYDVELAKDYLKKAGYDPADTGLTLHFLCRNVGGQTSSAVVAQNNLAEIGIDLVIDAYDQALFDTYKNDASQWDIAFFSTNMTTGFVTEIWEEYLGSRGDDGTVGFVRDAKLQELLETAKEKNDSASLNAFRDYANEQAYCVNAFMVTGYQFARSYITDARVNFLGNLQMNTATLAPDFKN